MKLFGSLTAISFSPIVTIEPRRRKFHCPIKLKIPLPAGHRPETSANLRLLCSITGGQSRAVWEDVTGSTPLTIHQNCLLFTTTVSARFWLVHCQRSQRCLDAARFAQELWRYLVQVPFMAKFVVFAKRRDISEANVRVFCMTDDKEEKTLEVQEHYTLVARSRDVEVLDNQLLYLEFGGNLIPAHLGGSAQGGAGARHRNSGLLVASSSAFLNEQLAFAFRAFQENRLAFVCRLREVAQEPSGRIAFMEDSLKYLASLNAQQRAYLNERRRRAVCTLGVHLPAMCVHYDNILGTPKRNSYYANARIGDLTLADIASELAIRPVPQARNGNEQLQYASESELTELDSLNELTQAPASGERKPDWMRLAPKVGIPRDEVDFIAEHCGSTRSDSGNAVAPALLFLMHWYRLSSADDRDQDLARALCTVGREDIARKLNFPIEPKRISRSTAELLREIEAIPVRSTENLYGTSSELSGYATSGRGGFSRGAGGGQAGQPMRGTSLRRLDGQPSVEEQENSFERQRARAGSASSSSRAPFQPSSAANQPSSYFSSGLRSAGQSFADDVPKGEAEQQVPVIEVSQVKEIERRDSDDSKDEKEHDEHDQRKTENAPDVGEVAPAASEVTELESQSPVDSPEGSPAARSDCQLDEKGESNKAYGEQERPLPTETPASDESEARLRRELQETAEKAIMEALVAPGDESQGRTAGGDDRNQPGEFPNTSSGMVHESERLALDPNRQFQVGREDEEEDDEATLAHSLRQQILAHGLAGDRSRALSSSSGRQGPESLGDFLQDLSEMSNLADRIDSILDQTASEHSTRSDSRMRSHSPMPQIEIEQQQDESYGQPYRSSELDGDQEDEVD